MYLSRHSFVARRSLVLRTWSGLATLDVRPGLCSCHLALSLWRPHSDYMNILARTDILIAAEDIDGILALDDNALVGIGLYGVYDKRYSANPALLNEVQLDLLLSMQLENAG